MKKFNKKLFIVIAIIVVLIFLGIYYLNTQKMKSVGYTLEYMNSDDITSATISPTNIHVVIAKYVGSVRPKTISKFSYNFAYEVIPSYIKLIKDKKIKENDKFFYINNKKLILKQTGIDNYEEFSSFIKKISVLNDNLEVENYIIPIDSINPFENSFEAKLNIKYKDNEEISFDLKIENNSSKEKTGIKIL